MQNICILLDSVDDLPRLDEDLFPLEPDALKVVVESGPADAPIPRIDEATLRGLVALAEERGLPLFAHIASADDLAFALSAGVRGFAHIPMRTELSDELAQEAASSGAVFMPTLAVEDALLELASGGASYDDASLTELVPAEVLEALQTEPTQSSAVQETQAQRRQRMIANLQKLRAAGARIVLGTDAGIFGSLHGRSVHDELLGYAALGMSSEEPLRTTTQGAADALHLSDRGRIAEGLRADLLVVQGSLSSSLQSLSEIRQVIIGGEVYDPQALSVTRPEEGILSAQGGGAQGDVCLFEGECQEGLICDRFAARCTIGCTFPNAASCPVDTTCTQDQLCLYGDGCDLFSQDCENGAACHWVGNGTTLCFAAGAEAGAPCEGGFLCAPGSQCNFNVGRCERLCAPGNDSVCDAGESCIDVSALAGMSVGQCG